MRIPLVHVPEHVTQRGRGGISTTKKSPLSAFCSTLLVIASTLPALTGCRTGGAYWPNLAWWNRTSQDADASKVADSKSSDLPQLPSANATPMGPAGLAAKPKSSPSATIKAGGTMPDSAGAVPASYPTTPYPAIPAIQAVNQAAVQQAPTGHATDTSTHGTSPAGQSVTAPVQTGPYTSGEAAGATSQPGLSRQATPQEMPGSMPAASDPATTGNAVPAYRTADTRAVGTDPLGGAATEPNMSPSQPRRDVGDRYAVPTTSPAGHGEPPVAAAQQHNDAGTLGGGTPPATPSAGPILGTHTETAGGGDRYPLAGANRYGGPPAGQTAPPSQTSQVPAASGAGTAAAPPPTGGFTPPATTIASPPSRGPRTEVPAAAPAVFRPGGTSDYRSPTGATPPAMPAIGNGAPNFTAPPAGSIPVGAIGRPNPTAPPAYPPYRPSTPAVGYPPTSQPPPGLPPAAGSVTSPPLGAQGGYPSMTVPYNPGSTSGSGTRN